MLWDGHWRLFDVLCTNCGLCQTCAHWSKEGYGCWKLSTNSGSCDQLEHFGMLSHGLVEIQGTPMMDQKLVPSLDARDWQGVNKCNTVWLVLHHSLNQVQSQFLSSILIFFIYSACYQDNSANSIASTSEYDDSNYIATDHLLPTTHQPPITNPMPPTIHHPLSSIHRHLNAIAREKLATGDLGNST